MLPDRGRQCGRTKLQWQSLKLVARAGVQVRLSRGTQLREAYAADGTVVGAGIQGLRRAKCVLLANTAAELVVGSLNWSTSSKAIHEAGVDLSLAPSAAAVIDYTREFDRLFEAAVPLAHVVMTT